MLELWVKLDSDVQAQVLQIRFTLNISFYGKQDPTVRWILPGSAMKTERTTEITPAVAAPPLVSPAEYGLRGTKSPDTFLFTSALSSELSRSVPSSP